MNSALLSIRTDEKTKKEITEFASSIGLSTSTFMTIVAKQAIQERRVVLEPELKPTPYLRKIMKQAEKDLKAGKASGPFTAEEAAAHLHSLM